MEKGNITEISERNPQIYGQSIYKGRRKKSPQQVVLGKLDSHVYTTAVRTQPFIIQKNKQCGL